ncbi:UNVERIFIED_CONTAM: Alpha-xylosidase 1 [Sesamum radiatum]|uniref:Alpha-xylosidase 1 n=1 Tax=Sesamum radiatum TaxID=300843 RepID=A0AAW2V788_SESRA
MFCFSFPLSSSSSLRLLLAFLVLCVFQVDLASASTNPPKKIGKGYRLISIEEAPNGGLVGHLQVKEKNNIYGPDIPSCSSMSSKFPTQRHCKIVSCAFTGRQGILDKNMIFTTFFGFFLHLSLRHETDNRLRIHITDAEKQRWEVPYDLLPRESPPSLKQTIGSSRKGGVYKLTAAEYAGNELIFAYKSDPFSFSVKRKSNGETLFDTSSEDSDPYSDLVFKDQYLEISTKLPKDASFDWGVFDLYFFPGPSPLAVVDQYTAFIGRPAPMPYWAFGFHQCRWGYHNLSVVEDVVENYKKAKIPLDVIWNDDDHMDGHKDFTLNPTNYPRPKLLAFLEKIHARGMKYIVIIDPGIGVNKSYGVYQRGLANDVFIKYEGKPFLAQVWPGAVNFPDFLNPKTVEWWGDEIQRFHKLVPVDGLWIDMNEASNFCNGLCTLPEGRICPNGTGPGWICCLDCKNITKTRWDDPPYKINASGLQVPIGYKTIATSAYHYNGVLEYDAHSLYGFSQSVATHKALQGLEGKRPFILSRSTYVGQADTLHTGQGITREHGKI